MTKEDKIEVLNAFRDVEVLLQQLKHKLRMAAWGENSDTALATIAGARAMLTNVDLLLKQALSTQPQLNKQDCSLSIARLYSFAETLASGNHEWRYDTTDSLWRKDGWASRTTDELLELFPGRL